jgi:DNA-binding LytR/AlgR family response regulator
MHDTTEQGIFCLHEVKSLLTIGACDDETRELDALETLVGKWGETRRRPLDLRRFDCGEKLLAAIAEGERFDMVFLDIFMGSRDGVSVAREIRKTDGDCAIVFTTNSRDHAIDGFGVRATHYLLKPVAENELYEAIDRAMRDRAGSDDKRVQITARHEMRSLDLGDIRYAESRARIVTVHSRTGGDIAYYDKLDNFERLCDDERFLRCHKSFLVNLDYARSIANSVVKLDSGEEIPVSKSIAEVKARFAAHVANKLR